MKYSDSSLLSVIVDASSLNWVQINLGVCYALQSISGQINACAHAYICDFTIFNIFRVYFFLFERMLFIFSRHTEILVLLSIFFLQTGYFWRIFLFCMHTDKYHQNNTHIYLLSNWKNIILYKSFNL